MHHISRYRRRTLALFMVVSLIPALTVAAVWYVLTQLAPLSQFELQFSDVLIPVFIVGVIPAFVLSFIFAELLARPVEHIHDTALRLAKGDFRSYPPLKSHGEFAETTRALQSVSSQLERMISETTGENKLIEAERNKLQGVLNSMTDGVFALDRSGRIILFNHAAAKLTCRNISEVAGQLAEKVLPFRLDGELVMARWLATRHGTGDEIGRWSELELYRGDGSSIYVAVQAVVLHDDPNGIRALVTFHDLTRDHELEEMKIDFVALAAHELRTPITEIKGYLDILSHEAKALGRNDRMWLNRSISSVGELSSLINNLLNVARIEHGEISMSLIPTDYAALLADAIPGYATLMKSRKLIFSVEIAPNLPPVMADSEGIREVLHNFISNAINYTPAGGSVTLRVVARGHEVDTTIEDTGRGIPAKAIPRLFTKFYRVSEFKARTRGTGLGLFICRSIVEAHDGHVWVDSKEGKGSVFGFSLRRTSIAPGVLEGDNTSKVIRGPHGWIKTHSLH